MEEERAQAQGQTPRHAYPTTGGAEVYVEDREVVTVTTATTQKHGPCLIIRTRDGEKLWVLDDERCRRQLRMGQPFSLARRKEGGT